MPAGGNAAFGCGYKGSISSLSAGGRGSKGSIPACRQTGVQFLPSADGSISSIGSIGSKLLRISI
jgi:hypothetical protein